MSNYDYKGFYRRNLPHLQPLGGTLFITCCLAGSLPQSTLEWYEREKANLVRQSVNLKGSERAERELKLQRRWFARIEGALHKAETGPLCLKDPQVAKLVNDALHFHDGKMYRLDAFCIMPNHVHLIVMPLEFRKKEADASEQDLNSRRIIDPEYYSISRITHSFKGYTASECNRILKRKGEFWLHESYDHAIRDSQGWERVLAYVINNPVKAQLVQEWRDWPYTYVKDPM